MYQSHLAPERAGARARPVAPGAPPSLPGSFRRICLLLAALFLTLPLAVAAAQTSGEPVRPESSGGDGPTVQLPVSWMMEPAHLYRREVFMHLQMELLGMPMGMAPMEARTRQEVTFRTSRPDEEGQLYALLTVGEPEVLEGSRELTQQLEALGATVLHLRVTPDGRWEVLKAEDGQGKPLAGEASMQGMIIARGPVWPEAPRVGSTWQIPLNELAGSALETAGLPEVAVTATLEAVEGQEDEQVARIGYLLPQRDLDLSLGGAGTVQAWVEVEGRSQVRVRDGWPLTTWLRVVTRSRMPGAPSSGAGSPEMLMRLEIEEQGLAEEPLADPLDRPW